jgi:predicted RNase H-like HicB family nuclease
MKTEITWENSAVTKYIKSDDWKPTKAYKFHILIERDEDHLSYSAIVLNLPGIGSCGDTAEEAMANVREAIQGALEAYKAADREIPWKDSLGAEIPAGASQAWIIVDG